jgi:type VI secretion system secreted protein Hcp
MPSDYLLEVDGIKGESQDAKHKETIEIESFSWGASHPGSFASGTGGATGKVNFQDLHFTTLVNKSSPNLALACATGKHIDKAMLYVRKATGDGGQQEYYTITLEHVLVSSYQSSAHTGANSLPQDNFALNFAKVKFEYKPQNDKGGLDPAITFTYDLQKQDK